MHHCSNVMQARNKTLEKPCNARTRHAKGIKTEAENHGKTGDARCKTGNRDPVTCMSAKASTGSDKVWKTTFETKSTQKTKCSKL